MELVLVSRVNLVLLVVVSRPPRRLSSALTAAPRRHRRPHAHRHLFSFCFDDATPTPRSPTLISCLSFPAMLHAPTPPRHPHFRPVFSLRASGLLHYHLFIA
ncbi:hypothetical protein FB451DRAFT_1236180 [Mycena latifolia]|nr:hypothetical protein FB451DRAFT_1236180 [Mycena latifolia]